MKSEAELIQLGAGFGLSEAFVRQLISQFGEWATEFIIAFLKERGVIRSGHPGHLEHDCCKHAAAAIGLCLDGDHQGCCENLAAALACCCSLAEAKP